MNFLNLQWSVSNVERETFPLSLIIYQNDYFIFVVLSSILVLRFEFQLVYKTKSSMALLILTHLGNHLQP